MRHVFLFFTIVLLLLGVSPSLWAEEPLNLKVMTLNLHRGRDLDGRNNLERFLKLIEEEKPDIVALQEVERQHLSTLQASGWNVAPGFNANRPNFRFGNVIMTPHRIVYQSHHYLPSQLEQRGVNEVALEINGQYLHIINTHLGLGRPEREGQFGEILRIAGFLEGPLLVVGDFNAGPRDRIFTKFPDGFSEVGTVFNLPNTFPTGNPKHRIDMIWFSGHWKGQEAQVLSWEHSDHLPVTAELQLKEPWGRAPVRAKIPPFDLQYNPLLPDIWRNMGGSGLSRTVNNEKPKISKGWVRLPIWRTLILGGEFPLSRGPLDEFEFFVEYRFKEIDFRDYFSLWGMRGKAEFSIFIRAQDGFPGEANLVGVKQYYRWSNHLGSRLTTSFSSDGVWWTMEGIYLPSERISLKVNINDQADIMTGVSYAVNKKAVIDGDYSLRDRKLSFGVGFYW